MPIEKAIDTMIEDFEFCISQNIKSVSIESLIVKLKGMKSLCSAQEQQTVGMERLQANEKVLIDALYDAREYINVNAYAGCPNACLYLEKLDKALTHVEGENR